MGLMAPKIESAEALKKIASEYTKPFYKRIEFWMAAVADIIAVTALLLK